MNKSEDRETPPGLALRIVVSIIVFFGLLIFAIIYAAFFASSFTLFQQIAVILVALLVAIAVLGAMWSSWGIKVGKDWNKNTGNGVELVLEADLAGKKKEDK